LVDAEWILEGGLSWTQEDLARGLGSAMLASGKDLAAKKRIRLELLPLWDVASRKLERAEGRIPVPLLLLRELKYFPAMVNDDDSDAFKIYLGLLRTFQKVQSVQLDLTYEEIAQEIPSERVLEASAASFQVLKALERLEKNYGLLRVDKKDVDRAALTLLLPDRIEANVGVPIAFFQEGYIKDLSPSALFAYFVILYRSQMSGESPVWVGSTRNVEQDFPLSAGQFKRGTEELRRQNLIEIYPFKLTQESTPVANLEYRYLLNPVLSQSEKLANWSRLREQSGDEIFKQARQAAEAFGEPEDPKVIVTYLELLKQFPFEDVLALTQQFERLAPESTPSRLEYLRSRLEHESLPHQLAT
jgi:hypothetical protein